MTTIMPSFKSFRSGGFVYRADIQTHIHTYTHAHRDEVIAIYAPPYYVVGAENKPFNGR